MTASVIHREPKPRALRGLVRSLWSYETDRSGNFEFVLPTVTSQLLVNLTENELRHWHSPKRVKEATAGIAVQGALTRKILIDAAQKQSICGVEFAIGGSSRFHRQPAVNFTNRIVDARSVWSEDATKLRDAVVASGDPQVRLKLIENFLTSWLIPEEPAEEWVLQHSLKMLTAGETVAVVIAALGISQHHLYRLFERRVGMRPKLFSRIARFGSVLDARSAQWADLAAELGFADQAHMVRESAALIGVSPRRLRPVNGHESRHFAIASEEMFNTFREPPDTDSS